MYVQLTQPIPSYAEMSCVKNSGRVSNLYHSNGPTVNPTILHINANSAQNGKHYHIQQAVLSTTGKQIKYLAKRN